jgi:polar amino acid transport system substrate-binding protein
MKQIFIVPILYLSFYLFFIQQVAFSQDLEKITIAIGEWPPYMSKDLKHYGAGSRIIKEAFESRGIRVEFKFYPWKRTLLMVKKNKVDATGLWGFTKEREAYSFYSEPVIKDNVYFYHLKSFKFDWQNISDLKGLTVGGTLAYNYGKRFNQAVAQKIFEFEEAPTDLLNLKKVLHNRIHIYPLEGSAAAMLLNKYFKPEERKSITYHQQPLRIPSYYLLMSRKNPHNRVLIDQFNQELKRMRKTGKIEQYFNEALNEN